MQTDAGGVTWVTVPLRANAPAVGTAELRERFTGGEGWNRVFTYMSATKSLNPVINDQLEL